MSERHPARGQPGVTDEPSGPLRITVLMGGDADERDVSLATGAEVAAALREAGHEVVAFDTVRGVLTRAQEHELRAAGVSPAPPGPGERDRLLAGHLDFLAGDPSAGAADVFVLALHGGGGEDGTLQALLDTTGTPYTGSEAIGCALAMDKDQSKRLFRDAGIPTPEWCVGLPTVDAVGRDLGWPVIVKALHGGSSLRLELVHGPEEWPAAAERAADYGDPAVVEAFVAGREFTVGIVGGRALPVGEIVPRHEIFDYECKYQPDMADEIFPADLGSGAAERLQQRALAAHEVLRLADYSRVDFIVDAEGEAWCLEANALPGMTANSLLPKAAQAAGIGFPELCDRIARLALARAAPGTLRNLPGSAGV
jgi:D-alanine-D-alanine ligase